MSERTLEERLIRARVSLQKDQPFFGYLLARLPFEKCREEEEASMPTMGTNGYRIVYNPNSEVLKGWSDEELKFVLCHEVLHVILKHILGRDSRFSPDRLPGNLSIGSKFQAWNSAADYAVNYMLKESDFHMPHGVLYNSDFKQMTAEAIYEHLVKQKGKGEGGGGKDSLSKYGSGSGKGQSGDNSEENPFGQTIDKHMKPEQGREGKGSFDKEQDDVSRTLVEAANYAAQRGTIPAGLERIIGDLLDSALYNRATWADILRAWLETHLGRDNFTYRRPHRRTLSVGYYIPSLEGYDLEVFIGLDTSGSISPDLLREFALELEGIRRRIPRVKYTIMPIDARCYDTFKVEPEDDLFKEMDKHLKGGGGTDFRPLFDAIEEGELDIPRVMVFFTDGDAAFPEHEPDFPVIWLYTNTEPPWGERVKLDTPKDY